MIGKKRLHSLATCYLYNTNKRDSINLIAGFLYNLCFVLTDTDLHIKTIDTNKLVYTLPLDI